MFGWPAGLRRFPVNSAGAPFEKIRHITMDTTMVMDRLDAAPSREECMSREFRALRLLPGAAVLSLVTTLLLGAPPATADDYDVCVGSTAAALDACTRVINSPKSSRDRIGNAYINRGQHYYEKDDYDRAIEDFNRAIPYKPSYIQLAYGNRGNAYAMKGENDKAIDSYSVAISLDKNYSAALTGRGLLYQKAGEIDKAREDFNAALRVKSTFNDDKWAKDTARQHLADLDSGSGGGGSRQTTPSQPSAPSTAASGDYDTCMGSSAGAIDACTRVINSSKSSRDQIGNAYIGRGQQYYEKDDYDRAIEDFNKAMSYQPSYIQLAYGNRGNAYAMKGDNDRAIDSYSVAISLDKNYSAAFTGRGLIYEKMGEIDKAREDYNTALRVTSKFQDEKWAKDTARKHLDDLAAPSSPPRQGPSVATAPPAPAAPSTPSTPSTNVGDDYNICVGSTADAIDACTRVISSARSTRDQVGNAYIGRGQHYYEKDDYDRAIADFNKAIPLKPKWLHLAYGNRGNAQAMKNLDQDAIDSYDQAIAIDANYSAAYTGRGLVYEKMGLVERARGDYEAALNVKSEYQDEKWAKDTARAHLDKLKDK
jgi:tetratricopeptide (TPR) repeat protein